MGEEKIRVTYRIKTMIESPARSIELLLAEMTVGIHYVATPDGPNMSPSFEHVPTIDPSIIGEVEELTNNVDGSFVVTFALPASNVDASLGGVTHLWTMIAGEVFNFHFVKEAQLTDIEFPPSFLRRYEGPAFGFDGVAQMAEIESGPLWGAIIKPNLGLTPDQAADLAGELATAGFNFLKDDEISVNPALSPLADRVKKIAARVREVRERTGHRMLYAANVTSDFATIRDACETAITNGADVLMIDAFCTGLSAVDFLKRTFGVPIYVHRVGYGLLSLSPDRNIDFAVLSKVLRMFGADFSHVGTLWGKSPRSVDSLRRIVATLTDDTFAESTIPVVTGVSLENIGAYQSFYGDRSIYMDHIDIYGGAVSAEQKLNALRAGGR